MAVKQKLELHTDPMVMVSLAVVFLAVALIFLKTSGLGGFADRRAEAGQEILKAQTPEELMVALDSVDTQFGTADFDQLEIQVKGL